MFHMRNTVSGSEPNKILSSLPTNMDGISPEMYSRLMQQRMELDSGKLLSGMLGDPATFKIPAAKVSASSPMERRPLTQPDQNARNSPLDAERFFKRKPTQPPPPLGAARRSRGRAGRPRGQRGGKRTAAPRPSQPQPRRPSRKSHH